MRPIRAVPACCAFAAFTLAAPALSTIPADLRASLVNDFKFSSGDLADLEHGKVVKRVVETAVPGEVAVVGATRIKAAKAMFLERARDIVKFKNGPDVVEIGRFGSPPALEDLAALTIDKNDFDLRSCQVTSCDIRLSADVIARFQREIDWKAPDADARAASLFKEVLLENVRAFVTAGPGRIVEYDDERKPVRPIDDFLGLLDHSPYVDRWVPGMAAHLRDPAVAPLAGADDVLYWSKEKFGIAPFITVTFVAYATTLSGTSIIASRDVYSSRYFDASLSFTIAADAAGMPGSFYLVYANRSRADALKGSLAGLRRSIVERRSKGSIEDHLKAMKQQLEAGGKPSRD